MAEGQASKLPGEKGQRVGDIPWKGKGTDKSFIWIRFMKSRESRNVASGE